ncbi:unnamed protein product, partial [Oppiella nova]
TGPKGVIKDWQRYKQFESEKRESDEREKLELMKKLSITCRSHLEEELAKKAANQSSGGDNEDEFGDDMNDPFLKEYMIKRMKEMMEQIDSDGKERPVFGKLLVLNSGAEFLEAIDKEMKFVTIICHIFTNNIQECIDMNGCLDCLAKQYANVKFCAIEASIAGMSKHFSKSGVPALLVYKAGNLLANFVRLGDEFSDRFFAVDVERFLVESVAVVLLIHGVLNESLIPNIITTRTSRIREGAIDNEDDDSD